MDRGRIADACMYVCVALQHKGKVLKIYLFRQE